MQLYTITYPFSSTVWGFVLTSMLLVTAFLLVNNAVTDKYVKLDIKRYYGRWSQKKQIYPIYPFFLLGTFTF